MENVLFDITTRFVNASPDNFDEAVDQSLRQIGQLFGADRCYLFLKDEDRSTVSNTHEWCAPGIAGQLDDLQALPLEDLPNLMPLLNKKAPVTINDPASLPGLSGLEERIISIGKIQSLSLQILEKNGNFFGFLGIDRVANVKPFGKREEKFWKIITETFTGLIDRIQTGQKLLESKQRISLALESSNDGYWDWDLASGKVVFSSSWKTFQGYRQQDSPHSIGDWKALIHPADLPVVEQKLEDHLKGIEPAFFSEHRIKDQKGEWNWWQEKGVLTWSAPQNKPGRMLVVSKNIHSRVVADRQKELYTARLGFLSEVAIEIMELQTEDEVFTFIGKKLQFFFGEGTVVVSAYRKEQGGLFVKYINAGEKTQKDLEEVLGFPVFNKNFPLSSHSSSYHKLVQHNVQQPKEGLMGLTMGSISRDDCQKLEKLLKVGKILVCGLRTRDTLYGSLALLLGEKTSVNIPFIETIARMASVALSRIQYQKELDRSRKNYQTLVNTISEGLITINKAGEIIFVNKQLEEITGYEEGELEGQSIKDTLILPEDHRMLDEKVREREKGLDGKYEMRFRKKCGEIIWMRISSTPYFDSEGKFVGSVAVTSDITRELETRKLEKDLEVARRAAETKQQFLTNMSHEMRTPLNGIIGTTGLLLKSRLNREQKEMLEILKESSGNLLYLVNNLLEISRSGAGKRNNRRDQIMIPSLLEKTISLFQPAAIQKNISLKAEAPETLKYIIEADAYKISEVLSNLIGNALKFTQRGGFVILKGEFRKGGEKCKDYLRMEVKDNGPGIREEDQRFLFQKFSQVDQSLSRPYQGAGLGLAISKELVEQMQGTIGVESSPGKGSCFWFEVPVTLLKKNGNYSKPDHEPENNSALGMKVLVVEDQFVNHQVLSMILKGFKCQVDVSTSGKEVFNLFEEEKYDVILMDIRLPDMDGITITKKLKEKYQKIPPIIAITAEALEGDQERFLEEGLDDYLPKPVKEQQLYKILKKWKERN